MPLLEAHYYSFTLHMNCSLTAFLPQSGHDFLSAGPRTDSKGKIPVLWLLHGMGDDYTGWQRFTNIERYAAARGIAVIMPGVLNECLYANMACGLNYFDYIADELPKICRELFPQLSADPEENVIAGLSMGGYGALKIGLTYPERFSHIGCLSCGNLIDMDTPNPEKCEPFILPLAFAPKAAFGTDSLRDVMGTENDLYWLLKKCVKENRPVPDMYLCTGTEDPLLTMSQKFKKISNELLPEEKCQFHTGPGGHVWDFWDEWIPKFMDSCRFVPMMLEEGLKDI